jgi:23S rRNA pseudouridine1911/1915/1917 synthase
MQKHHEREGTDYTVAGPPEMPLAIAAPMSVAGRRLDAALAEWLPEFSRNRLKTWIEEGRVTVDGGRAEPKRVLRGGEAIEVRPHFAEAQAFAPQSIALDIVYEDASLIVVDKPPGLVAHPAAGNWEGTLLNALLHHAPELAAVPRAGIVHRLDKDTSGLLVVARTVAAQTHLVRQLQARTVAREYVALVAGELQGDTRVEAAIGRHPKQRTRMAVLRDDAAGAKPAVTHVRLKQRYRRDGVAASLIECRLETGRTHQIRVHLQHLGHPLVGDQTYGVKPWRDWFPRQALHARRLGLVHPADGRSLTWESPLPADFRDLIASLERA